MSEAAGEGTGAGLQEFLSWAGSKGEMNPTTAEAWAVACRRVLELEDDPEGVDLRKIDVDVLLVRFENLNRTKYSASSMTTYKSRFRAAVTAYLAWLVNEPWKPAQRNSRKKADKMPVNRSPDAAESKDARSGQHFDVAATAPRPPAHDTAPRLVSYQVPLRPDLMIEMTLPVDLSEADSTRIAAFVRSLAFTTDHPSTASAGAQTLDGGG